MKKILRILAVLVVVAAAMFWVAAGANQGWTKNRVEKKTVDEVTGLEGVTYEDKFMPGVDFLAIAMGVALALGGSSFLFRTKSKRIHQTENHTT